MAKLFISFPLYICPFHSLNSGGHISGVPILFTLYDTWFDCHIYFNLKKYGFISSYFHEVSSWSKKRVYHFNCLSLFPGGQTKFSFFITGKYSYQIYLIINSEKAVILKNRKYFCNRDIEVFKYLTVVIDFSIFLSSKCSHWMEFENYRVSKGKTTSYVDLFGYFFNCWGMLNIQNELNRPACKTLNVSRYILLS